MQVQIDSEEIGGRSGWLGPRPEKLASRVQGTKLPDQCSSSAASLLGASALTEKRLQQVGL